MKKLFSLIWIPLLGMALFTTSCRDTFTETRTYTAYVPTYMSYDDLRASVAAESPSAIQANGKIYLKDQYLFVNEKYKGIHIFDNSDPAKPVNLGFVNIPGNVDISVKGNYLFADSYVDLVVLDISDITHAKEVGRMKDVFPYTIPDVEGNYPIAPIDQKKGVITGWTLQEYTEKYDGNIIPPPIYYFDRGGDVWMAANGSESGAPATQTVGVGGSLARCIIAGNTLYVLNQWQMQLVDITVPDKPVASSAYGLNRMAETVFIDGTYLYIGTQTGILIYDIKQPAWPVYVSAYDHIQSCDPVVVQDGIAYVTMRSGNRCGSWQNLLDVINLGDPKNPVLLKSYPMAEPYGLGIDNKTLFLCDGAAGLKIFNVTNPLTVDEHLIKTYEGIQATDVIPYNGILILISEEGIFQFDYSDPDNIVEVSRIPFSRG